MAHIWPLCCLKKRKHLLTDTHFSINLVTKAKATQLETESQTEHLTRKNRRPSK